MQSSTEQGFHGEQDRVCLYKFQFACPVPWLQQLLWKSSSTTDDSPLPAKKKKKWSFCIAVKGSGVRTCYTASRPNLNINKSTKVICQGFTGKQVSTDHLQLMGRETRGSFRWGDSRWYHAAIFYVLLDPLIVFVQLSDVQVSCPSTTNLGSLSSWRTIQLCLNCSTFTLILVTGNLPQSTIHWLWDEHGGRRVAWKGRKDTFGFTSIWHRERSKTKFASPKKFSTELAIVALCKICHACTTGFLSVSKSLFAGQRKNWCWSDCNLRPAARRCQSHYRSHRCRGKGLGHSKRECCNCCSVGRVHLLQGALSPTLLTTPPLVVLTTASPTPHFPNHKSAPFITLSLTHMWSWNWTDGSSYGAQKWPGQKSIRLKLFWILKKRS